MKNRIEVKGISCGELERRLLPSGITVANARLGETYMIHRGDWKLSEKYTNWHRLSFYGEDATAAASLEKGSHLFVVGTYETREVDGEGRLQTNGMGVKRLQLSCHWTAAG